MDYKEIGKRIRKKRLEYGWKISELAEKSNLSDDYVGKIERGTGISSLETIVKIANSLDISLDYLLGKDLNISAPGRNYLDEDINKILTSMEASKRKRFIDFIYHCSAFFENWN